MKIEAVIFDHDGVLNAIDYHAAQAFFGTLLPISLRDLGRVWEQWLGEQRMDQDEGLWPRFCAYLSDEFDLPVASRRSLQEFNYLTLFRAFPDARPALIEVRRRGLRVGVLSNTPLGTLEAPLTSIGLADLVDATMVPQFSGAPKPAPAAYFAIARKLGVATERCLFFDDEPANVEGATAVGMKGYLVERARSEHDIPQGVLRDLSGIQTILDEVQ
jgi:putative hydrolase of the HAD superfamily